MEQSFPDVGGTLLPIADPATGRTTRILLTARDANMLRKEHGARLASLIRLFQSLDFDPVLLGTSKEHEIDLAFLSWAHRRRFQRRRAA